MKMFNLKIMATVQIMAESEEDAAEKYIKLNARELFINCLVDEELVDVEEVE